MLGVGPGVHAAIAWLNAYAYNITVRECIFECEPLFEARVKEPRRCPQVPYQVT